MARSQGTRYPSGGSDLWQGNYPGPTLLRAEFFGASTSDAGYVPVWTGAAYVRKPVKTWTGAAWAIKPAKRRTATDWSTT